MHRLLRNLFVFAIFATILLIYTTEAGLILSKLNFKISENNQTCNPTGADCVSDPPCCSGRCKINWSRAWCA